MANTGDDFVRWAWQAYTENVQYGVEGIHRWFSARWYRYTILATVEALALGALWWSGAL